MASVLAGRQLDRGRRLAVLGRRDGDAVGLMPPSVASSDTEVSTHQVDVAVGLHRRGELELHAEILEGVADLAVRRRRSGTGNWPPARNAACWPDIAVSVGSASVRSAPRRSSALSCASSVRPPACRRCGLDAVGVGDARGAAVGRRVDEAECRPRRR